MRALPTGVLLVLAACAAPIPAEPPPGRILPDADGLSVEGTSLQIGFGRAMEGAIAAATRLQGSEPLTGTRFPDCTRVTWRDGLSMDFIGGTFTGWSDVSGRSAGRLCA